MKFTGLTGVGVATVAALGLSAPAMADDMVEDKLATMEQRIKYLEERVASQDQMIVEKEGEMAAMSDGWFNSVSIGGVIELDLVAESPAEGDSTAAASVATMEIGIAAAINDEWGGEILLEKNDEDGIDLADAFLTYEPGDGLSASAGQQGVPFGVYDTNLISDPLTKEMGDTGGVSLVLGGEAGQMGWGLFALQRSDEQFADIYGVTAGFAADGSDSTFSANVSWINDLSESEVGIEAAGMAASTTASLGPASAIVEYVTALDAEDADPSAWHIEVAYGLDLMGRDATVAVGASGADESAGLAETLMLLGISVDVWDGVGVGIEYSQREEYDSAENVDAVTALLAAEF